MMAVKKEINEDTYKIEVENNQRKFVELMKIVRPELYVLMDLLDQTGINWFIIIKVIHALNNAAMGGGWADIKIELRNNRVLFIRGEEQMRLDEPLLLEKKDTS